MARWSGSWEEKHKQLLNGPDHEEKCEQLRCEPGQTTRKKSVSSCSVSQARPPGGEGQTAAWRTSVRPDSQGEKHEQQLSWWQQQQWPPEIICPLEPQPQPRHHQEEPPPEPWDHRHLEKQSPKALLCLYLKEQSVEPQPPTTPIGGKGNSPLETQMLPFPVGGKKGRQRSKSPHNHIKSKMAPPETSGSTTARPECR